MIIYILVLSLQLSGSIMLLTSCFGKTKMIVVNDCINGNRTLFGKNDFVNLDKDSVIESLKRTYLNRTSFFMISSGYILSIFDKYIVENQGRMLLIIIVVVTLICILSNWICNGIAKCNANRYVDVKTEDLPNGTSFYQKIEDSK